MTFFSEAVLKELEERETKLSNAKPPEALETTNMWEVWDYISSHTLPPQSHTFHAASPQESESAHAPVEQRRAERLVAGVR